MRFPLVIVLASAALIPARAEAQVSAQIVLGKLPVVGWVTIGTPPARRVVVHHRHYRPDRRVVVSHRRAPRGIVLRSWTAHRHDRYCRHDRRGRAYLYYDREDDRWYDRPGRRLRRVEVIFHGGRYYRR